MPGPEPGFMPEQREAGRDEISGATGEAILWWHEQKHSTNSVKDENSDSLPTAGQTTENRSSSRKDRASTQSGEGVERVWYAGVILQYALTFVARRSSAGFT